MAKLMMANLPQLKFLNLSNYTERVLMPNDLNSGALKGCCAYVADVLNMTLFGKTARQWRDENPNEKGSIGDHASVSQLVCLANPKNLNTVFIEQAYEQSPRLEKLNQIAIQQMQILLDNRGMKHLEVGDE